MAETVADFLLRRLSEWGISRIYGYPGDGINGILGAFDRAKDRMRFIQTRHEEMAAFMACAHAKEHVACLSPRIDVDEMSAFGCDPVWR